MKEYSEIQPSEEPKERNSTVTIPENINEFSLLAAAKFYRDTLGYAPHPLTSPDLEDGGKAPILTGWKQFTPAKTTDDFLKEHFGDESKHNLGCVVRGTRVVIDLDSKEDHGASVREWLEAHPEMTEVPREGTRGGAHLHYECRDLPDWVLKRKGALPSKVNDAVTAELFFEGCTIVMSTSIHKSGYPYRWEVMGDIPEITWAELAALFGFAPKPGPRGRPPKEKSLGEHRPEDLRTLDLPGFLEELGLMGECLDAVAGKFSMRCPWKEEHSGRQKWKPGSDTVVFKQGGKSPGFKCLHAHCSERDFSSVIAYAEKERPGILSRHCGALTISTAGRHADVSEGKKPQIALPGSGRSMSQFAAELGEFIALYEIMFSFNGNTVVAGKPHQVGQSAETSGIRLCGVKPSEFVTLVERFVEVGTRTIRKGNEKFIRKSMSEQEAKLVLLSRDFTDRLPRIDRVLEIPVPIFDEETGLLIYPAPGYNPSTRIWLSPDAPTLVPMDFEEAKSFLLGDLLCGFSEGGFCWRDGQAQTHALARLITAFCRGLMGWHRTPLWIFVGNREGCGKDTCANIAHIVYLGRSVIGAPLRNDDEMRKRITSDLRIGKQFFHLANMKGHVKSPALEAATDNSGVWEDRLLGESTPLILRNEMEFSFSANNASWEPDIDRRSRPIYLHAVEENINSRRYRHEDFQSWVFQNRVKILSAINALVVHWVKMGRPSGPTKFASFPEWARVVGGIHLAGGFGDPCLPCEGNEISGDRDTPKMLEFFELAHEHFGDSWIKQEPFMAFVKEDRSVHGIFDWIDFFDRGGPISFRRQLQRFDGRILGGIEFTIEKTSKNNKSYRFTRSSTETPLSLEPTPCSSLSEEGKVGSEGSEGSVSPDGADHMEIPGGLSPGREVSSSLSPRGEKTSLTSPTSLHGDDLDLDQIAADLTSSEKPFIALTVDTEGSTLRDGEIRRLSLQRKDGPVWSFDPAEIGYDLGPLTAILGSEGTSRILMLDARQSLPWLRAKCGLRVRRVSCLTTASRLLTAGREIGNTPGHFRDFHPSDAEITLLHVKHAELSKEIEEAGLKRVWTLENRLLPVVMEMEARGCRVDVEELRRIGEASGVAVEQLGAELRATFGDPELDLDTPATLLTALQGAGLNLNSTSKGDLKAADDGHLVPLVLERRMAISRSQQAANLLRHVAHDNRIHARFDPCGTVTGRFSSNDPSLQNIARGELRRAFVASPHHLLIVADYSQVELRAASVVARDAQLIEIFNRAEDPYRIMAGELYGKQSEEVTEEERRVAKTLSLGLLNGLTSDGLKRKASEDGIQLTSGEAQQLYSGFLREYAGIGEWHRARRKEASEGVAEVRTPFGRRRLLPEGTAEWDCFTALLNTPVQGGCADGMKLALLALSERMTQGAHLIATVHDEIVVEVPEGQAEAVSEMVRETMTEALQVVFSNVVPFPVDIAIRKTWGG